MTVLLPEYTPGVLEFVLFNKISIAYQTNILARDNNIGSTSDFGASNAGVTGAHSGDTSVSTDR